MDDSMRWIQCVDLSSAGFLVYWEGIRADGISQVLVEEQFMVLQHQSPENNSESHM